MNPGSRKLKAFYATLASLTAIVVTALVMGTTFSGDNIVAILALYTALFGVFAGGNAVEHMAKKGQPVVPIAGEVKAG